MRRPREGEEDAPGDIPGAERPRALVDGLRLVGVAAKADERELRFDEARVDCRDANVAAEQVFANLSAILAAAGAGLTDVVRVGIVMRALQRDRPTFNQVWAERFGEHRPARSAIEAADFGRAGENARYMVEATAYRG